MGGLTSSRALKGLLHNLASNGVTPNVFNGISDGLMKGMLNIKGATAALAGLAGGTQASPRPMADFATRIKLVHLLESGLDKAQQPGGNPQSQINDLIIKLQNLARESEVAQGMSPIDAQQELQQLLQKQGQMMETLQRMLSKQAETAKNITGNIR
ncbi:MAG: hypothetical protein H6509_15400 [Bryobacterales bacterium]|nr:hypothetical protein [Bryobacterales bacterium]